MNKTARYITIEELTSLGLSNLPSFFKSKDHLIYSSPAALAFNSPGAEGFGVKRAGLSVPGSVMLIVSPPCCARNTELTRRLPGYENRFFYLTLDEIDMITGRHIHKIPDAALEIMDFLDEKPSVFMICTTCADALLGTDMEAVCKKTQELINIPVRPCYMYALEREGSRPPMVQVRQSLYSLLEPKKRCRKDANILGFFSPVSKESELFDILNQTGAENIRQISTCESYEEFLLMAQANFSVVLGGECRPAAFDMSKNLGIPYIELADLHDISRIQRQYKALSKVLGADIDDKIFYERARQEIYEFAAEYKGLRLSVGECMNADPFELSMALSLYGLCVSEIYGTVTDENYVWVKALCEISPDTKVYSNLDPSMYFYDEKYSDAEFAIGRDAMYYHRDCPGISWNSEVRPFGYQSVRSLLSEMGDALEGRAK